MNPKEYYDFATSLTRTTISNLQKKIFFYIFLVLLSTPIINSVIVTYGGFSQISYLNFSHLPIDIDKYLIILWFVFWLLIIFVLETIIFILPIRLIEKARVFLNKHGVARYSFTNKTDWENDWDLQGGTEFVNSHKPSLLIKYSNSGCLLRDNFWKLPHRWKNFKMSFDLTFPSIDGRALGIIFRALDLENYFMIQVRAWRTEGYAVLVKPHIRLHGNWEVLDLKNEDLVTIAKYDSTTESIKISLLVKGHYAVVQVNGDTIYSWRLPSNSEINMVQHVDTNNKFEEGFVPKIPFCISIGKVGFRAYPGELAIIKNLTVSNI